MQVLHVAEDNAHAEFVPPLFSRLAAEFHVELSSRTLPPMRGDGRAIIGLRGLLVDIRAGAIRRPDAIIVGIDADCGPGERRRQVSRACEVEGYDGVVLTAEPDPHIEAWYLADPAFVQGLLRTSNRPATPRARCKKDEYKNQLRETVQSSGAPAPLGGVEYGPEIAEGMDLYRACRDVPSFGHFVDGARALLRQYAP